MSTSPVPAPLTVTQLTRLVKGRLTSDPTLEDVLVEGELSNLRNPGSGHLYFTLKDGATQLRCVCFRSQAARIPFNPVAGMTVLARGTVDVYEADGTYQLYVRALDPSGVGALAVAVEQRRRALAAEGLFAENRKRRLPLLPRRVAVVTSSTGAAVRDVVSVARRRNPAVGVVVVPTPVQGEGAEASIVRALAAAARRPRVDVILLVRGGGSMEDLAAFQSEAVVRAVAASPVPVVTGVGHETDTTLADLAADRRGATPSNAAELTVPEASRLRAEVRERAERLRGGLGLALRRRRDLLHASARRLELQSPVRRLPGERQSLDHRVARLGAALRGVATGRRSTLARSVAALEARAPRLRVPAERAELRGRERRLMVAVSAVTRERRARLRTAEARLSALSPLRVLERGYSITLDSSGAVARASALASGDLLRTRLADGEVTSRVE